MSDSLEQDTTPRKLLRWAEGEDGPGNENDENTNEGSAEDGQSGSNSEAMVPPKREDWYGSKMKRLKDNVEKLRQEIRDKERDYVRLKNKYNVMKRKQEQLEEDLRGHSEVKLDTESEVELLRLQLIEKDKELVSQRSKIDASSHEEEKGGKTTPEVNCGIDTSSDVETSLESCLALGDSFLARKYLMFHKDGRRWLVYGILAAACLVSLVTSLGMQSSLMSSIAVGLWTLGLFFLGQERKELFRALRLKHMKKIRELSVEKSQVVEEKRRLETRKVELEGEVAQGLEDKAVMSSRFTTLSEKFDEATTKNEELAKREKGTLEELQSERVRRRRGEEQLEEVLVEAALAKEEEEALKGGEVCEKLQESLKSEQEENAKLGRENQRLIEEIVAMNMKEEREKMEREKEMEEREERMREEKEMEEREERMRKEKEMEEREERMRKEKKEMEEREERTRKETKVMEERESKEKMDIKEKEDTEGRHGEMKSEETKAENTDSKIETSSTAKLETTDEVVQLQEIKSSMERSSQTFPSEMDDVNVPNGRLIEPPPSHPPTKPCLLCSWKVPTEIHVALCVVVLACFVWQLQFIFSSQVYIFACLLFMAVTFGVYRVSCSSC